ncbi:MAG TPA: hypothetical protein VMZ27_00960 [Candidatus Saccharimonadales bacterium]|nr:hypothetical protein [Candidatus Saccharimonadales bacterium]
MKQPERGSGVGLRMAAWFALTFGRRVSRLLLYPTCLYYLVFDAPARNASKKYLQKVLTREPRLRELFQHFYTFATVVLDRIFLLNGQFDKFEVHIHGEDIVVEMLEQRSGCVLLGAHMGSFEIVRSLGRDRNLNVSLLMYEENAREIRALIQRVNPELTRQVIALGTIDSMLKVEAALARGEFVGILADRDIRDEGATDQFFFDGPVRIPTGPFRAAMMMNRPAVLMVGLFCTGNRYDIYFERLISPLAFEKHGRVAVDTAIKQYVARLEHYCSLSPYNWFNFYDFWK